MRGEISLVGPMRRSMTIVTEWTSEHTKPRIDGGEAVIDYGGGSPNIAHFQPKKS